MKTLVPRRMIAASVIATVASMVGLSYASVPLYRMFCAATGYGGTTQVAATAPLVTGQRSLTVRFDANIAPGLDWSFAPETDAIKLLTGKTATVFFKVTNHANHPVSANAQYNVTPDAAGLYFDKIACFCFSEQTLAAGETAEMPVVFFLDPALEKDETMHKIDSLTLSYTFFSSKSQPVSAAERAAKQL